MWESWHRLEEAGDIKNFCDKEGPLNERAGGRWPMIWPVASRLDVSSFCELDLWT